jgi:hypothetical protein
MPDDQMLGLAWTLYVDDGVERAALPARLLEICCRHLNLCAAVGCGCLVAGQDQLCSEAQVSHVYHSLAISSGPTWCVTAVALRRTVVLSVYTDGPVLGSEVRALHEALVSLGYATFQTTYGRTGF